MELDLRKSGLKLMLFTSTSSPYTRPDKTQLNRSSGG
jgi:hypothetical protein